MNTSCEIRWMPQNTIDDKLALILVLAWCRQATSHYLSQCWPDLPRPMSPCGVTRPQWVNKSFNGHASRPANVDVTILVFWHKVKCQQLIEGRAPVDEFYDVWSSHDLQWLDLKIWHLDKTTSNIPCSEIPCCYMLVGIYTKASSFSSIWITLTLKYSVPSAKFLAKLLTTWSRCLKKIQEHFFALIIFCEWSE